MGVANTKSTIVTNADAAVQALNVASVSQGRMYAQCGTVETAAADDAGSVYRIARVHSSWRILHIWLYCDAVTNMSTADVGLYQTAANGGAVVDVDCYTSSQTVASALTSAPIDAAFEARGVEKIGQRVWEDAGLSADSDRWYDLAITATTNDPTAAATISFAVEFTAGN